MKNYLFNIIEKLFDRKWRLILILTFISFFLSYLFFNQRELMSEYLIVNTVYLNDVKGFQDWFGIYFYDGQRYISQMGIHGFLFSLPVFIGVSISSLYIWILILLLTILFYYFVVSTAIELKLQFGKLSALFFLLTLFFNPIFLLNSGNLYWVYFIYILPFYFSLKYYGKFKPLKFYIYLFLIFLIKFLVNFEYSSTIVISSIVPIALKLNYEFLKGVKVLLRNVLYVFISSLVSFVIVISVFLIQISQKTDTSFHRFEKIIESYSAGSKNEPHFLNYENRIIEWNSLYKSIYKSKNEINNLKGKWDNIIKARNSYKGYKDLLKYFNFENKIAMFYSLQLILFTALALFILSFMFIKFKTEYFIFFALISALVSTFSWVILMPLHFYLHSIYWRGISDVILVFPFYITTAILFGYIIENKFLKL